MTDRPLWKPQILEMANKGLCIWCLTPLSTTFHLYSGGGKWSTQRKTPTLSQVTEKL
jgi:hypothetical protein